MSQASMSMVTSAAVILLSFFPLAVAIVALGFKASSRASFLEAMMELHHAH